MYVETVPNRNSPPAVLLREGWREHGRVRKRTLANLSHWPRSKIETLRRLLKDQPLVSPEDTFDIVAPSPTAMWPRCSARCASWAWSACSRLPRAPSASGWRH